MGSVPQRLQPVGKSGPLMNFINWGMVMSGLSIWARNGNDQRVRIGQQPQQAAHAREKGACFFLGTHGSILQCDCFGYQLLAVRANS